MLFRSIADYLEQKSGDLMFMPYAFQADKKMLQLFDNQGFMNGTTVTAPGFYAPQGRVLRGRVTEPKLVRLLNSFKQKGSTLTNIEMETAGIYGMARLLGHRAISVSAILANRMDNSFSEQPQKIVDILIEKVLRIIAP